MSISPLFLLSLSLFFARVLADLTDAQAEIVKQRLAQGSQQRYTHTEHPPRYALKLI